MDVKDKGPKLSEGRGTGLEEGRKAWGKSVFEPVLTEPYVVSCWPN